MDDKEYSSCEDYSDADPYSSDEEEYEVPQCYCGKDANRRISGTDKNWMRPFFNCPKRKFDRQCGFFVWEDELFDDDSDQSSEESSDQSSEESSYVCDECLEKEQEFGEIESANADDKVYVARVKQEPLEYPESEFNHRGKRIKDEDVADYMSLFGKVKVEPIDQEGDDDDMSLFGKVKVEPINQNGDDDDMSMFGKVKVEPIDQDGDESGDEADSVCDKCGKLKRKIDDIQSARDDDKASWDKEKLELLTKLETVESELGHIKKKTKLANYGGVTVDEWNSEKAAVEVETETKLDNEVDEMPLLEKLSNSKDEIIESEMDKAETVTKFVKQADHMMPSDKLTKSEDETADSALGQIEKKSKLACP